MVDRNNNATVLIEGTEYQIKIQNKYKTLYHPQKENVYTHSEIVVGHDLDTEDKFGLTIDGTFKPLIVKYADDIMKFVTPEMADAYIQVKFKKVKYENN